MFFGVGNDMNLPIKTWTWNFKFAFIIDISNIQTFKRTNIYYLKFVFKLDLLLRKDSLYPQILRKYAFHIWK